MSTVLIVEDDKDLLAALKAKLEREGYRTLTAQDGVEALTLMKQKPDGVLLDLLLPKKSGMEVLEEIHSSPEWKSIPVIIISNSGQEVEIERAEKLGARDYLVKTDFTPQEVLDKLTPLVPSPSQKNNPGPSDDPEPERPRNVINEELQRGLVLVVEDDAFLRRLLVEKLKKEGFKVEAVEGGKEALEFMQKNPPALVLLDLVMPGLDGFQVLQEMKKNPDTKGTAVIVLSNLGEKEHIDRAKSLGADEYMVKAHFILDEIVDKVAKVMTQR